MFIQKLEQRCETASKGAVIDRRAWHTHKIEAPQQDAVCELCDAHKGGELFRDCGGCRHRGSGSEAEDLPFENHALKEVQEFSGVSQVSRVAFMEKQDVDIVGA